MPNRYSDAHKNPQGPGDARPTALKIVEDEHLQGKLTGKILLITGVSSGIGLEMVKALSTTGATIYGTARDIGKAQHAITSSKVDNSCIHLIHMDLTSLASVKAGALEFLQKSSGRLNVLVENAGAIQFALEKTDDGFEKCFGVNHLAHFLLFQLVKDALLTSSSASFNSRVVMLTSAGYKHIDSFRFHDYNFTEPGSWDVGRGYGQSKLANIWMANHIERIYASKGLHAMSVNPGISMETDFSRNTPEENKKRTATLPGLSAYLKSSAQLAASPTVCAVARQFEGVGGLYVEDCDIAVHEKQAPFKVAVKDIQFTGYTESVSDAGGEEKLWEESLRLVSQFGSG